MLTRTAYLETRVLYSRELTEPSRIVDVITGKHGYGRWGFSAQ